MGEPVGGSGNVIFMLAFDVAVTAEPLGAVNENVLFFIKKSFGTSIKHKDLSPSGAVHAGCVRASPQLLLSTQAFASTVYSFAASSPVKSHFRGRDIKLTTQFLPPTETW